ncbi:MAG TPA: DUF3482 domain-containing protein [Ideonella sp.]|uniref:DUF3482 domain-containing protein n=1 Tax=Ideonella sp. TaxID=1929293 RepID=UPI002E37E6AB|nr:DUF3482 domain-containing protein [Ideonella sp.]HEX5688182.1 DUF3482 domain-containing protein [Ideonella sp.]
MLERPIVLAVVGHVNAGKTAVIRTLTRSGEFGEVDEAPGTTKTVVSAFRRFDACVAVRFDDTPGIEDPVALLELLQAVPHGLTPADRIRAFLRRPDANDDFAPEARALRAVLDADAVVYVVDTREAVLPKFRCEMSLLVAIAKPIVVVLNHLHSAGSRLDRWPAALNEHGMQAQVNLDAAVPGPGSERLFYQSLAAALANRRPEAQTLEAAAHRAAASRRNAGMKAVANCLVGLAALRRTLSRAELADEAKLATCIDKIRQDVVAHARAAHHELLQAHDFRVGDADVESLPGVSGRWEDDLFDPEALKISAQTFGKGAAVGAAIGLGLDIALAGLSLGVGTAVGAAIGGAAGQGFAPMGRALVNKVSGQQDVTVENAVLLLLCDRLLKLEAALEERGHGAVDKVSIGGGIAMSDEAVKRVMDALSPARSHAAWATGEPRSDSESARRNRFVDALTNVLAQPPRPPLLPEPVGARPREGD